MNILLSPPIAFLLYIPLVLAILWLGQKMAGPGNASKEKSSAYGSGEESPTVTAIPGYRPFFLIAFFFAILHLGMLVLGSGAFDGVTAVYIVGLVLALVALILG